MTSHSTLHILGISGSLRKASYNTAALKAARELAPADLEIAIYDIAQIPLYNDDLRANGYPDPVARFREAIKQADGLLLATPEYNYSIPGVLKNAIDWASRLPDPPLVNKPVAMIGASTGTSGTVRAQMHLRQVFLFNNMYALNKPEVLISRAQEKFDAAGKLTDEATRTLLRNQLLAFADWIRRLRRD